MITKADKKNAVWNSVTFILISLIGFVSFSLTIKSFDSSTIGLFILLNSVLGLGTTFDFGFGMSTIKYIAEAKAMEDYDHINSIIASFLVVFIIAGFLISIIMICYYYYFIRDTSLVSVVERGEADFVFLILAVSNLFRYISNYFRTIIEGYSEFILSSKLSIAVTILNFVLILILYIYKLSIIFLAIITLTVSLFAIGLYLYSVIFSLKNVKLKLSFFNFSIIKKYSVYGINIQLSFLVGNSIDTVIKFLTGSYLSLSFVTYYETAKKIIDITNGIILSANKTVFNILSEHNIKETLKQFINEKLYVFSKASNYYNFLIYGIANPILCFFILYWFKSFEAMMIFMIFIIPYSLISIGASLYSVIMIRGKGKVLLVIQSVNFAMVFIFLFISLKLFENYLGLLSYYVATINSQIMIYYFLKKNYDFDVKKYFREINFYDLVKLNVLLILQLSLVYFFPEKLNYILITFFLMYLVMFSGYLKYFAKELYKKAGKKYLFKA